MNSEGQTHILDNQRRSLAEYLRSEAPRHDHLSIATGYWDLKGMLEIIDQVKDYKSIRLVIGKEPLTTRASKIKNIYDDFPKADISEDLQDIRNSDKSLSDKLRSTAMEIVRLVDSGVLKVKVRQDSFLHAKTFIFGTMESSNAIGIIGSSNFTGAGLTGVSEGGNLELNAVENNYQIVTYNPNSPTQENGHLSWFNAIWNDDKSVDWTGDFTKILRDSPVGDLVFGPYDTYIKTLMEYFPDELAAKPELDEKSQDILYRYQNRNASILINKLETMGTAILADSVGLGKTITAGAVINHYIGIGRERIVVIVPAALKSQWKEDLANVFHLMEGKDYQLVSQQDINAMREKMSDYEKVKANVDLFVIDEAHNLRNENSERYQCVMEWLQDNQDSRVLMLTATPINNSLNDLANLIQLGLKGSFDSVQVPYQSRGSSRVEMLDFLEVLKRIQKASKTDDKFTWDDYRSPLINGISRYLVRSTRQGVEAEGSLASSDGTARHFPDSIVKNAKYRFEPTQSKYVADLIDAARPSLDNVSVRRINIDAITSETQRSMHPLDFAGTYTTLDKPLEGVIPNMFQLVTLLGFVPYKTDVYQNKYYGKNIEQIDPLLYRRDAKMNIKLQLSIHNMLQVTWLKRLESSTYSLQRSVNKYYNNLRKFIDMLNRGYVFSFSDLNILENQYDDDIEDAFEAYNDYVDEATSADPSADPIKKRGVERRPADPNVYNIAQMLKDAQRDMLICELMNQCLNSLTGTEDSKLRSFVADVKTILSQQKYGKKVLVFSFFADTINYLRDNLRNVAASYDMLQMVESAEFVSGQTVRANDAARRFSPKSKKYTIPDGEREIDFLYATDVLSEGQNLQDAAILVNYDLHWNPVRMIQRNGRVNRLGSDFSEVVISNMVPEDHIEMYLKLVARLQGKIDTIKNTVGLDQGVLQNDDVNPMEFVDDLKKLYGGNSSEATATMNSLDKDDSILSWTNDHVFALRDYLATHNEREVNRIKSIPLGKWSYLPAHSTFSSNHALGMVRVSGRRSITDEPIIQTIFVDLDTSDGVVAPRVIDDQVAMNYIQTIRDDNDRRVDSITLDRSIIARRAKRAAIVRAQSKKEYSIKPSAEKALAIVSQQNNFEFDPLHVVEQNLRDSRRSRLFEKLVRSINAEVKDSGAPNIRTVTKMVRLLEDLNNVTNDEPVYTGAEDILYYKKDK